MRPLGRFFRWAAHDDSIAPTFMARCVEYLETHPDVILCYPSTRPIDEEGKPLSRKPEDTLGITATRPSVRLRQYFDTSFENRQCNAVLGVVRTEVLRRTGLIGPYTGSDKVLRSESPTGPYTTLSFVEGHGTILVPQDYSYTDASVTSGIYCRFVAGNLVQTNKLLLVK